MKKNIKQVLKHNKYKYIFLFTIIILGIISGIIFSNILSYNDKKTISETVGEYLNNLKSGVGINYFHNLINSLGINFCYLIILFILSLSIIGVILNPLILYFKSFIIGFTVGIMINIYHFNGILLGFFLVFPHQIINLLIYLIVTFYGIRLSLKLYGLIFFKQQFNFSLYTKKYLKIFLVCSLILIISSLYETFLGDFIIKVFTFFIK